MIRSKSHPSRGAWIEIFTFKANGKEVMSHPSRGAWIEIKREKIAGELPEVAPLTGCVD